MAVLSVGGWGHIKRAKRPKPGPRQTGIPTRWRKFRRVAIEAGLDVEGLPRVVPYSRGYSHKTWLLSAGCRSPGLLAVGPRRQGTVLASYSHPLPGSQAAAARSVPGLIADALRTVEVTEVVQRTAGSAETPVVLDVADGGRYWDRTSGLCGVKILQGTSVTWEYGQKRPPTWHPATDRCPSILVVSQEDASDARTGGVPRSDILQLRNDFRPQ